ncbi:tyrosine-type recombinase/integrase [Psychroserpens sp. SPM9]|uniref:tyrosine-type recombinase/integrase n=1 Tax=Psychroserpens sp. SPM9 TaxID=2975598 RepID=UPI0021A4B8F4|nr:tyrosine-type recombinase/integrase [Psychroserpens sp. SPM9]MDG5490634.1 tyrosine-type recombinase/integrase [Psychroserpens sp. SPM9]
MNGHISSLKRFNEYLKKHNAKSLSIHLRFERTDRLNETDIVTQNEIKELFKATEYTSPLQKFRLRDKAILVVLYSCGLRRNEAVHLNLNDVLFDKERIVVKKTKNKRERFVPINSYNLRILEDYVYDARPEFYKANKNEALFINSQGGRLGGMSFKLRLRQIIKATNDSEIIEKRITPEELTYSNLLKYAKYLQTEKNYERSSTNNELRAVKLYYDYLIEKGETMENPAEDMTIRGKRIKVISNLLSEEELEDLYYSYDIEHYDTFFKATKLRDKVVLGLMVFQGITGIELYHLQEEYVQLNKGKIDIPSTRRSNARTLKLQPCQMMDLLNYTTQTRSYLSKKISTKNNEQLIFGSTSQGNKLLTNKVKFNRQLVIKTQLATGSISCRASLHIFNRKICTRRFRKPARHREQLPSNKLESTQSKSSFLSAKTLCICFASSPTLLQFLASNAITTLYKNEIFIKSCSPSSHQKLPQAMLHNRSYKSASHSF